MIVAHKPFSLMTTWFIENITFHIVATLLQLTMEFKFHFFHHWSRCVCHVLYALLPVIDSLLSLEN